MSLLCFLLSHSIALKSIRNFENCTYLLSDEDLSVCKIFKGHHVGQYGLCDDLSYFLDVEMTGVLYQIKYLSIKSSYLKT